MKRQDLSKDTSEPTLYQHIVQIAHDMRAPMAALMAVMESPGDIDSQKKTLAKKAIWRTLHLVESILVHNHKPTVVEDFSNLNDTIMGLILEKNLITYHKIPIEFVEDQKSIFLQSEKVNKLERVLCNVLQNSIEALVDHKNPKIKIFIKTRYSKVYIRIEDNGPGMPAHIRRKIGIMPITYMKENGHGYGLYNSKKIMNEMGGRLVLRSRNNVSTTVTLVV